MTDPPIIRSKSSGERLEPMKIFVNGEKLSARQALEKYPKLKNIFNQKLFIFKTSRENRNREGKIPLETIYINPEIKLTRKRQIKNNIVVHHEITINANTPPHRFF